jgi:GNAT superfamily N-acetyltransferase
MNLRSANAADAEAILHVHTESLMILCAGDYTPQQLEGWAKLPVDERWLARKFERGDVVLVAEDHRGMIIGFGERAGDEIRAVYVHPLNARRGVGSMLLRELERSAAAAGVDTLRLDSSLTAEPFYKRCGYQVESRGMHDCGNGTTLQCVRMRKSVPAMPSRELKDRKTRRSEQNGHQR